MKRQSLLILIIVSIAMIGIAATYSSVWKGDDIIDEWYTENNKSLIKIYKNKHDYYFGKITWLKDPNEPDGKPKLDKENPDAKLKKQPLLGLIILRSFRFDDDRWSNGTIYDPENGKTYKCTMKLEDRNTLNVRGYIGISAIGRSTTWKRKTK